MSRSSASIGILREVKNTWERRVPLTPSAVNSLVSSGIKVFIQPSTQRIFTDIEYQQAGATVTDDLSHANTILGVKEFPSSSLIHNKAYLLFSHTIKAQPANMPFLDECLKRRIRLFDYECIRHSQTGQRLVAFGYYAGLAGMIDGLRGVGQRLLSLGYSTPFMGVASAYMYPDLHTAKRAIQTCGEQIKQYGLPRPITPFRVVFTGRGNVSEGAQHILSLLPHTYVQPHEMSTVPHNPHTLYATVIEAQHMVRHRDPHTPFDKHHYYEHPNEYEPVYHSTLAPYTSFLVNCMYWDAKFPRLLTNEQYKQLQLSQSSSTARSAGLLAIADISCDLDGSIQFTKRATTIDQPFFLYNGINDSIQDRITSDPGVLVLAVDNLPAEFPKDASEHFSQKLAPFIQALASQDNSKLLTENSTARPGGVLPMELMNACIASDGQLTPNYQYIERLRRTQQQATATTTSAAATADVTTPSLTTTLLLKGHLFDTNFINHCFDVLEYHAIDFRVVLFDISPNRENRETNFSKCVLEAQFVSQEKMEEGFAALQALAKYMNKAQATVTRLPYGSGQHNPDTSRMTKNQQPQKSSSRTQKVAVTAAGASALVTPTPSLPPVLVLGSGFVAAPLIDWLSRRGYPVTAASNVLIDAQKLTSHLPNTTAVSLDARDSAAVNKLISSSAALVISLLPHTMHVPIAQACLQHGKHLLTASYVSAEMQAFHSSARDKGLIFMNELGLDPGIDHMEAMRLIHTIQQQGGHIQGFQSLCGGLPAPEATNNPFAYKFSWSPAGMLGATTRPARYRKQGRIINIPGETLLTHTQHFRLNPAFALEQYPNYDAIGYEQKYGLTGIENMFRGTLRYAGTGSVLRGCAALGLMQKTIIPQSVEQTGGGWRALVQYLVSAQPHQPLESAVRHRLNAAGLNAEEADKTVEALAWLGALSEETVVSATSPSSPSSASLVGAKTVFDCFCVLLQSKLTFADHERDLVILTHEFDIVYSDRRERVTSTLLSYGGDGEQRDASLPPTGGGGGLHGYSAMARTVGIPAAIGADLILQGRITERGVMIPTGKEVYEPILQQLAKEGISFVEQRTKVSQK